VRRNSRHTSTPLNVGLSAEEVVEALLHSAVYCGMPKALNATYVAKRVFAEPGLRPVASQDPPSAPIDVGEACPHPV
jgi:4-carboxymuconolactone decarboxylase